MLDYQGVTAQAGKSCYSFGFGHVTHGTLENQGFREACYNVTLYFKSIKDKIKNFKICIRLEKICNIVTGGLALLLLPPGA